MNSKPLRLYLAAVTLSRAGNGMNFVALNWIMMSQAGNANAAVLFGIISIVPGILLSPFMGRVIDTHNPYRLHIKADILAASVCAIFLSLELADVMSLYISVLFVFIIQAAIVFLNILSRIVIRLIIGGDEFLLAGTSAFALFGQVGTVLGAILGGIVSMMSPMLAVLINAISFAASYVLLRHIYRTTAEVEITSSEPGSRKSLVTMDEAIRHLKETPAAVKIYGTMCVLLGVLPLVNVLMPMLVFDSKSARVLELGFVDAGFGVGGILAGYVLPRMTGWLKNNSIFYVSVLALCAFLIAVPFSKTHILLSFNYFWIGVFFHVWIVLHSKGQSMIERSVHGRIEAIFFSISNIHNLAVLFVASFVLKFGSYSQLCFAYAAYLILVLLFARLRL